MILFRCSSSRRRRRRRRRGSKAMRLGVHHVVGVDGDGVVGHCLS